MRFKNNFSEIFKVRFGLFKNKRFVEQRSRSDFPRHISKLKWTVIIIQKNTGYVSQLIGIALDVYRVNRLRDSFGERCKTATRQYMTNRCLAIIRVRLLIHSADIHVDKLRQLCESLSRYELYTVIVLRIIIYFELKLNRTHAPAFYQRIFIHL